MKDIKKLKMSSNLDNLKNRIQNKDSGGDVTSLYYLIKELGCLPDILGREYEVVYEGEKIKKIIQKPISIPALQVLILEMNEDFKRQEKASKKMKRSGRKK